MTATDLPPRLLGQRRWRRGAAFVFTVIAPLALAGCGGGAAGTGSGVQSTPPPPPTPPPPTPPPPPPPESVPTPPPFGVTTSQIFATVGVTHGPPNGAGIGPVTVTDEPADAVEFRWSETSRTYEMRVPGTALLTLGRDPQAANGVYEAPDGRGNRLVVFLPDRPAADIQLSYTSYGSWYVQTSPGSSGVGGAFAFGVPTGAGDVPTSGTGTYSAIVIGDSGAGNGYSIGGQARLVFDFAAGSLRGHMQPTATDGWGFQWDLGRYEFTQTVFGVGRTTFSGSFAVPGATGPSFFEGRFSGPGASELMARWRAPFVDPYGVGTATMQGIWLGKRE